MKNIIGAFLILGIIFSCTKDIKPTYIEGVGSTSPTSSQAENAAAGMLLPQNQQPVAINPTSPQPVQVQPQNAQQMQQVAPGMNPPHGKPGHRCDIAVGAPLNSPKGTAQNIQQNPQQITVNPTNTVAPAKAKTAPGMNPPHGEPGHRCDIAVGAPLNSPPGKTPTQTAPPAKTQTVVPASNLPATVAAPTSANTAPALDAEGKPLTTNPAHGQPGHRCDIAVGAPLK